MSNSYTTVQWNKHKRVYDLAVTAIVLLFIAVYFGVSKATHLGRESIADEILLIRSLAATAMVLLHIVLVIGPLARLNPRFSMLLYNRRHLGVITFLVALGHAFVAIGYYGAFGIRNPLSAALDYPTTFARVSAWPFEWFGLFALAVMFVMAATSHDFWLKNLSARWWKRLHLCVYLAFASVVLHVAFGAMQTEPSDYYPLVQLAGVAVVGGLHIAAGLKELVADRRVLGGDQVKHDHAASSSEHWIDVAGIDEIEPSRAKVVNIRGCAERIAVFRLPTDPAISMSDTSTASGEPPRFAALASVCAHQGGPLGEGQVIDGCATCPWHGYQYIPGSGCSPPPFTETVPTYQIRVLDGRVLIRAGKPAEPAAAPSQPAGAPTT